MKLRTLRELMGLLVSPALDPLIVRRRIEFMEENVALPVKALLAAILFSFLFVSDAFDGVQSFGEGDFPLRTVRLVFFAYVVLNLAGAVMLVRMQRAGVQAVQWTVFFLNLVDAIALAQVTILTGGLNTFAYWVFLALIIRNSVSVPEAPLQLTINTLVIGCYAYAGYVDRTAINFEIDRQFELDEGVLKVRHLVGDQTYEPYLIRIFLMIALMACCYGLQILFERQRLVEEDRREHLLRQEQLQAAGRLAAEIAHQLKNPLAIITNSAFALQRSLEDGRGGGGRQIQIIRDEVERADRIITELMGYAQLAEGKIEKLSVVEELEAAIHQVFPSGSGFKVRIERALEPGLHPLQMQRGHLREIFLNLLTNAREALGSPGGVVRVTARNTDDYHVVVTIEDSGPGIPPDKVIKVFEPYFTTKEKGTGLGLAIVKHNAEIYGGSVTVESGLGRGARFILSLPARTMMRLSK